MKRFFILTILALSAVACSVESEKLELNFDNAQELNATVENDACTPKTFQFGEAGVIQVSNDYEKLYVSIVANPGYTLVNSRVHVTYYLDGFPTVGNGDNLPPGQMASQEPNPKKDKHTFVLDLVNVETLLIASNSTFFKDGNSESLWVDGIPAGKNGKWSYFEYSAKECEVVCTEFLGPDNINQELTVIDTPGLVDIKNWTYEDFEDYVWGTLLKDGPKGGFFEPSLEHLYYNEFNTGDGEVPYGYFDATYTVTVGGCTDSILIGATVLCEVGC